MSVLRLTTFYLLCVVLSGCAAGVPTPPSPVDGKPKQFRASGVEVTVPGCEEMKRRAEEQNRMHPDKPIVPDC